METIRRKRQGNTNIKDTFTLAAASIFRYKGTDFKTPHWEFEREESHWNKGLANTAWHDEHADISAFSIKPLKNGEILLAGGVKNGSPSTSSSKTWLVDPRNGKVRPGPKLHQGRSEHSMLLLHDGRVLISGGKDFTTDLSSVEIFDPSTNMMSEVCDLKLPRTAHAVIELNNGNILIVGGETTAQLANAPGDMTDTVELLDLKKKQSSLIGRIQTARESAIIAQCGPKHVIISGGMKVNLVGLGDVRWVRDAELLELK